MRCRYNAVIFFQIPHQSHPMARLLGRNMGCLLCIQSLNIYSASVTTIKYTVCYIGPRYKSTWLYICEYIHFFTYTKIYVLYK